VWVRGVLQRLCLREPPATFGIRVLRRAAGQLCLRGQRRGWIAGRRACWQRVKGDPDIWVAIVTGAGQAFSSGADVESLASGGFTKPDRWRELAMI
jgi:hypothetical protein